MHRSLQLFNYFFSNADLFPGMLHTFLHQCEIGHDMVSKPACAVTWSWI